MGERQTPLGINATVGALAVVVCLAVPPHLDAQGVDARLAVLALGVAVFAATTADVVAAAVTAGIASLLFDGFVVGRQGDLAWHGDADLVRLGLLCAAAAAGLAVAGLHALRERAVHRAAPLPLRSEQAPTDVQALVPRQRTRTRPVHGEHV